MKTTRSRYLTMALILPLIFLTFGCDTNGALGDNGAPEAAFKIDCFADDVAQMKFVATGALTDEGSIDGEPLPLDEEAGSWWVRYRMLQGQKGTITLLLEGRSVTYGSNVAEGTFTILDGDGAYADFRGEGNFRATLTDERGLLERFEGVRE